MFLEDELLSLHKAGFVHHDIRRPSSLSGNVFDNVLLTSDGLRLIDVGISVLQHQVGDKLLSKYVATELEDMATFKAYFLTR